MWRSAPTSWPPAARAGPATTRRATTDRRAAEVSARNFASSTTLTTFGLSKSATSSIACAAVRITASASVSSSVGARRDQRRVDQRLVALHVDDDVVAVQAEQRRRPRRGGRCRWRGRRGSARPRRRASRRPRRRARRRRRRPRARARARGLARDAHDHRHAADVGQRLVGQARRRQARRDEDGERHARAPQGAGLRRGRGGASRAARASLSSITGMPSRTGKASPSARHSSSTSRLSASRPASSGPLQRGRRACR